MDALSPKTGASVTVTQSGAQTRTSLPALVASLPGSIAAGLSMTVDGTLNAYVAAAGSFAGFVVGDVIDVAGWTDAANNGRKRVTQITSTHLYVSDAALTTDASAETDITIDRVRLPSRVLVVASTVVPRFNLWGTDFGTPPTTAAAIILGIGNPLVFNCSGYDQFVTDGASGTVTVTPLENG